MYICIDFTLQISMIDEKPLLNLHTYLCSNIRNTEKLIKSSSEVLNTWYPKITKNTSGKAC